MLSTILQKELRWVQKIIKLRIELPEADLIPFDLETFLTAFPHRRKNIIIIDNFDYDTSPPMIENNTDAYSSMAQKCVTEERLILLLGLFSHLEPGFINKIIEDHYYSEIIKKTANFWYLSGLIPSEKNGVQPTGRFWIYLLSGTNLGKRIELISKIYNQQFYLINSGLIDINTSEDIETFLGGTIKLAPSLLINFFKQI